MEGQGRDITLKLYNALKAFTEGTDEKLGTVKLKGKDVVATTNSSGYIVSDIPSTTNVIFAYGHDYPAIPIIYNDYWYFLICYPDNGTMKPRVSQEHTITFIYADYELEREPEPDNGGVET